VLITLVVEMSEVGVTDELALDDPEVPPPLVAVTVNVYAVPLVRPVTSQLVSGRVMVQVKPPGLDVTV
jgi:hypothetical protein